MPSERSRQERPNFLVIVADDLGWSDLSCYGAPHIETPALDALAAEGIRFTDGYAGSATCSPTRISLYTGRYPGRLPAGLHEPLASVGPELGLPPEHPTLASRLVEAGYATAMFGKWHCGALPWFGPLRSGWQEFFGNLGGALDYFSKYTGRGEYDLREGDVLHSDLRYYTHVLTEHTSAFLTRGQDRPWLVNLNYTTPHWPWEGPDDRAVSDALTARVRAGDRRALVHRDGGSVETYREMVLDLDASVARVLQALADSGQADNTVVLFFSDNGGERFSYQWPLSGQKFSLLEGGIRVPTILRWPAAVAGGRVSAEPVVTMDWTATLLALAGCAAPDPAYAPDGRDLTSHLLTGEPLAEHDLFWRVQTQRALRRGRWKYWASETGSGLQEQLFDLGTDLREQADRQADHPELLAALRQSWERTAGELLAYPSGINRIFR